MVQFVYPIWVRKIVEVEAVTSARSGDSESSSRHLAALTIESSTGKSADAAAMVHRRVIAIPPSRVQRHACHVSAIRPAPLTQVMFML